MLYHVISYNTLVIEIECRCRYRTIVIVIPVHVLRAVDSHSNDPLLCTYIIASPHFYFVYNKGSNEAESTYKQLYQEQKDVNKRLQSGNEAWHELNLLSLLLIV